MDPAGKGAIATYSNDIEGKGYVVFDASHDRFAASSSDRYDNRVYFANIAAWLDQGTSSPSGRKILVYGMSGASRANETDLSELVKKGYSVKLVDRTVLPRLTARELAGYDQLWLLCDQGSAASLSDEEVKLVMEHNANGNGLLVVAAPPLAGDTAQLSANRVASRYGITFSGYTVEEDKLHVSVASNLLNRASELLGQALKIVKKA